MGLNVVEGSAWLNSGLPISVAKARSSRGGGSASGAGGRGKRPEQDIISTFI